MTCSDCQTDNNKTDFSGSRKSLFFEVVAFFLILVITSFMLSLLIVRPGGLRFVPIALSVILQNLVLVGLIFFFTRQRGEAAGYIGLTSRDIKENAILGVKLFIPFFFVMGFLGKALQALGLSAPSTLPKFLIPGGAVEIGLALALITVVAFTEEIIFRGYLIARFKSITASMIAAVALSTALFSLGHGYQGSAGVVVTGVMGLIFALVYVWCKSLTAPIVMHFLQNFFGIALSVLFEVKSSV